MRRYYALFFIGHGSRRVWLAGCTTNPTGAWVTQQARNLGLEFSEQGVRFLIRGEVGGWRGWRLLGRRRSAPRFPAGAHLRWPWPTSVSSSPLPNRA